MVESQGVLILERKDFALEARDNKKIEDLVYTDIAGSVKWFEKASMVIIFDEGKMKILKSRYPLRNEE